MASNDGNGEKTEQATAKKKRDARREGQVAKSRDLSQTVTLLAWTGLLAGLGGLFADRLAYLATRSWAATAVQDTAALAALGRAALEALLVLSIVPLAVAGLVGILAELAQVGPLFATRRIAPRPERLNPATGFKRVFSADNLIELCKAVAKTVVLIALTVLLLRHYLPDMLSLPKLGPDVIGSLQRTMLLALMGSVALLLSFFSLIDYLVQRWQLARNLRMSKADVRREQKDDQGDPQIRSQRRSLHQQWASQNAIKATKGATALLVNPTHIAVAILYVPGDMPAPIVTAKGEGHLASLMRDAARKHGVPIVRNVALARALHFQTDEDELIPDEFFEVVADIVLWADAWRAERASAAVQ